MLDFNHILSTPGYNLQEFYGDATVTLLQWQTWRKPRGVNWVYIIGVGGGGGGGTGITNASASSGGGGGGSGAQTTVLIPAMFVPDTLYIQAGAYGLGATTPANTAAGTAGTAGTPTYVCIEPDTTLTPNMTLLLANGGSGGGATATAGTAGVGGAGGAVATISVMPLAGRGAYSFFIGQSGTNGGTTSLAGVNVTPPGTGLMVTGGAGGGGNSVGTAHIGGAINVVAGGTLGQDFFPLPLNPGAIQAAGVTQPAGASASGFISRNYLYNFGGTGGSSSNNAVGGFSSPGGNGAPGCGGGGGGGVCNTSSSPSVSGNGGPGFVYIISW